MRAAQTFETIAYEGELPAVVNYADRLPPPRNQGRRGTCVAHAAAAVREFLEIQAGVADPNSIDLSEQFIYWWCKEKDNLPNVSGTYPHLGVECLVEVGAAPEEDWPYNPVPRPGDEGQGPPPEQALKDAWRYRLKRAIHLDPKDIASIKAALAKGKAVLFTIPIYNSWYRNRITRRFGKINMPLPGETAISAHAMALVGYVDDETAPGGGYFILRNSWLPWGVDNPLGEGYGTIPYAFLTKHNMAASTGDRASISDVYIRDNEEDRGETPSQGDRFNSPDIWVRLEPDGRVEHQNPVEDEVNWVYVRAWNLGPAEAKDVKAKLFFSPASTSIWPHNWLPMGEVEFPPIPAGEARVASLDWTPPDEGPFCFLAKLHSPDDPIQHDWSPRNDNNIAQKNLVVLQLRPGERGGFSFPMFGVAGEMSRMNLQVDRRAFRRGRVELKMVERDVPRGRSRLVEDEAKLAELALKASEVEEVELAVTLPANATPGEQGEIVVTQHYGRYLIGRLVVKIEVIS